MRFLKNLFYKMVGQSTYLTIVSKGFIILYRAGILKLFKKFDSHYIAAKLVSKGDTVIDIGANVGYYSYIFGRKLGQKGKVLAVEPVKEYRDILLKNTSHFKNISIIPYALGDKNMEAEMSIPGNDQTRHGLTRITDGSEPGVSAASYKVEIRPASEVFSNLENLSYIKCDIEGYEDRVIPGLSFLIEKFKPVIQIELAEKNFTHINNLLASLGYVAYIAKKKCLIALKEETFYPDDVIFLTEELSLRFKHILKSNFNH